MKEALIAAVVEVLDRLLRSTASKLWVELHSAKGLEMTKATDLYWYALQAAHSQFALQRLQMTRAFDMQPEEHPNRGRWL